MNSGSSPRAGFAAAAVTAATRLVVASAARNADAVAPDALLREEHKRPFAYYGLRVGVLVRHGARATGPGGESWRQLPDGLG
jgi:hypothetical protein